MASVIRIPELGIAIANVRILKWCVQEGASLARGQPLLEVETDKLAMEIPSEAEGVLRKTLFGPEAEMRTGTPVAIVGARDEPIAALEQEVYAELKAGGFEPLPSLEPCPPAAGVPPAAVPSAPEPPPGKILATPLARRVAREKGIDLALVRPSSAGGRITEQDVLAFAARVQLAGLARVPAVGEEEPEEIIPLHGARKALADHMVRSVSTSPHYSIETEVDCSRLVSLREELKGEYLEAHGVRLTYVPFVIKAMALAVRHVPIVNATVREAAIVIRKRAHVGMAVEAGDLIHVPVIRDPLGKTLLDIAREAARLAELARAGKLVPQDVSGGTITLTNVGLANMSIHRGTAIINQPQVAIVAMGKITDRVVAWNGAIAVRPIMCLVFTYDHRVVMGVPGARFAEHVKDALEHPEGLLEA